MVKQRMRYSLDELAAYLEEIVSSNSNISDDLYGLYIAYQEYGIGVFRSEKYRNATEKLKKEVKELWAV